MAGGKLEDIDFDAFYDTDDFAVEATIAGDIEVGLFNKEEIDTDRIQGVYPAFRCQSKYPEGTEITIDDVDYTVEAVLPLEFGEHLHALSKDGT